MASDAGFMVASLAIASRSSAALARNHAACGEEGDDESVLSLPFLTRASPTARAFERACHGTSGIEKVSRRQGPT